MDQVELSSILHDRRNLMKFKGEFYKGVVRPTILYGSVVDRKNITENKCVVRM